MAVKWNAIITNAGQELIAAAAGKIFNFTKAQVGSGTVALSLLAEQTAVTDYKKNISITSILSEKNVAKVRVQVTNSGITSGFLISQIGLFAKLGTSGAEVLFMICQAEEADTLPSESNVPSCVIDYVINCIIGNASSVTGNIDIAAFVTYPTFEEHINNMDLHISAELKAKIESSISKVSNATAGNMAVLTDDGGVADSGLKFSIYNGGLRITYDDGE